MTEFNPGDNTIDEVNAHLSENPQDLQAVLDAEKARGDDARSTLVADLEDRVSKVAVPAESAPVTVAPTSTPGLLDQFDVSPDRGYRVKQSAPEGQNADS